MIVLSDGITTSGETLPNSARLAQLSQIPIYTVGVGDAMATVTIGPEPIATVTIPGRAVGCDESLAINASQGPVCAPIGEGCYHLHQEYRLFAMQPKSCSCGKAIAGPTACPLWR